MLDEKQIAQAVEAVLCAMNAPRAAPGPVTPQIWKDLPPIVYGGACKAQAAAEQTARRQAAETIRAQVAPGAPPPENADAPMLAHVQDPDALRRMQTRTPARIGVGRAGPRLRTQTLLALRADHAAARDAVRTDVDPALPTRLGLFAVQTKCKDKNEFLTRPDLGRAFSEETLTMLKQHCASGVDVQLIVSDGLSSTAVTANAPRILPVLLDGLTARGLTVGTPIFVRLGRVGAQDRICQLLDAKVVCSLIGERPGLATAESMSAYISYRAAPGMPESRRTVVSNIHKNGIPAVEAGAYIVDVIARILEQKASGVELNR